MFTSCLPQDLAAYWMDSIRDCFHINHAVDTDVCDDEDYGNFVIIDHDWSDSSQLGQTQEGLRDRRPAAAAALSAPTPKSMARFSPRLRPVAESELELELDYEHVEAFGSPLFGSPSFASTSAAFGVQELKRVAVETQQPLRQSQGQEDQQCDRPMLNDDTAGVVCDVVLFGFLVVCLIQMCRRCGSFVLNL